MDKLLGINLKIVYDLFVSGGRDSVVAATIAYREARRTRWSLKWILIEINPEYCKLAEERLKPFRNTIDRYF
ncbi:MAG: hypothetical protein LZ173_01260 [Thaumarchaeota archaeon]|jgi:NH3-dependent NAD+ synthetase|nr:hypothetical protein [Candidatus Geocrenenecus arthurdayi]